jgi:hypothetical protein
LKDSESHDSSCTANDLVPDLRVTLVDWAGYARARLTTAEFFIDLPQNVGPDVASAGAGLPPQLLDHLLAVSLPHDHD